MQSKYTALLTLAFLGPSSAFAGGWTQPEGQHYVKVWERSIIGDQGFFADGEVLPMDATYSDHLINAYGEYGITDLWTVTAATSPLGTSRYGENSTPYVGATSVGVRRALLTGGLKLAAQVNVGYAPGIGETTLGAGTIEGRAYEWVPTVQTGHAAGYLQVGHGLGRAWVTADVGLKANTNDELGLAVEGSAQVGFKSHKGLVASLRIGTYQPLGDIDVPNISGGGQTRYVGFTPEVAYWFNDHWAVGVGFGGAAAYANAAAPSLQIGIEHK